MADFPGRDLQDISPDQKKGLRNQPKKNLLVDHLMFFHIRLAGFFSRYTVEVSIVDDAMPLKSASSSLEVRLAKLVNSQWIMASMP